MLTRYYTLQEVAEALGRSERQVYRDIYAGRLTAHKVGSHWRISQDDVDAYVNGLTDGDVTSFDTLLASVVEARPRLTDPERMQLVSAIMAVQ